MLDGLRFSMVEFEFIDVVEVSERLVFLRDSFLELLVEIEHLRGGVRKAEGSELIVHQVLTGDLKDFVIL
jgi:hypothetical protein